MVQIKLSVVLFILAFAASGIIAAPTLVSPVQGQQQPKKRSSHSQGTSESQPPALTDKRFDKSLPTLPAIPAAPSTRSLPSLPPTPPPHDIPGPDSTHVSHHTDTLPIPAAKRQVEHPKPMQKARPLQPLPTMPKPTISTGISTDHWNHGKMPLDPGATMQY